MREASEGGSEILIPVTLDDYVFRWRPKRADLARQIRARVIADFRTATSEPKLPEWRLNLVHGL